MWDWFNLRRRSRRQAHSSANDNQPTRGGQTQSAPSNIAGDVFNRPLRSVSHPFFIPSQPVSESPPKCLSRLPCSEILYGERVEDFSSDCWLENHLHRFGLPAQPDSPASPYMSTPFNEEGDDSVTGSSESDNSTIGYSDIDMEIENEFGVTVFRPRHALEELFIPPGSVSSNFESPIAYSEFADPPPYSQFPEEPPPTYEEATAQTDRRSTGTRSSSSSLAIMW